MNDVMKDLLEALECAKNSLVAFKLLPGDANRWEESDEANLAVVDRGIARAEAAMAAPQPDADGWINPNNKTQKQYLPHIGEKVLFCHAGVTYYGKHTGGSFQSLTHPRRLFNTWDCLWMYPPKAKDVQP